LRESCHAIVRYNLEREKNGIPHFVAEVPGGESHGDKVAEQTEALQNKAKRVDEVFLVLLLGDLFGNRQHYYIPEVIAQAEYHGHEEIF